MWLIVVAGWLLARTLPEEQDPRCAEDPDEPRVIAVDGLPVRGTVTADGQAVHLLSAYDTATGITLAQIPLADKGGEIAQVAPLVDEIETVLGSVAGMVFVADALHAQAGHAEATPTSRPTGTT